MAKIPSCQPDGPKLRALIFKTGRSVPEFARSVGRNPRSVWGILSRGDRASITFMRPIARGLGVKVSDISDWTGDDDIAPEPETADALSA
jgi:hypothetical protein